MRLYSSLAQLAEHLTVNQVVAGSSPAGGANRGAPTKCAPFLLFFRPYWLPLPVNGAVRRRRRGDRAERGSTFRYSSAPALAVALPVHRPLAPQAVAGSRFSLPADMVEMRAWRSARFISPYPWGIVSRKRKICLFAHSPVLPSVKRYRLLDIGQRGWYNGKRTPGGDAEGRPGTRK